MQITETNDIDQLRAFLMPQPDPNDIAFRFGHRIHELRTRRQLSQTELGKQCGLSAEHLNQIETGRMTPTLVVLELLALGFQTTISGLVEDL